MSATEKSSVMLIEVFAQYALWYTEYSKVRDAMSKEAGAYIKEWREIHHLSLRRLAFVLNVSPSFLSKVERGKETISPELAGKFYSIAVEEEFKDYARECARGSDSN